MGLGRGRALNFPEIVGFSEILMFSRKIFGILLLAKIKISNTRFFQMRNWFI